jgi:PKD repeat protein
MPGTNTKLIPLTAITDEAGYYAFPFVPPGEPFTVQAIAPGSGDTANADGVAGAVSELVTVPLVFTPAGVVPGSPVAAFSVASTGLIASFDASASTDADGTVEEYLWDFGDGSSAVSTTSPTIEHRYDAFGSYTVNLTAIDDEAKTGAASQSVTLDLGPGTPTAAFTVTPVGSLPGVFRFDASSSSDPDAAIVAYRWDFGDGGFPVTTTETEVERIFLRDPTVAVSLTVTDEAGQFDNAEQALATGVDQPYIGDAVEMVSIEADGTHTTEATGTPRPDADGSRIIFRLVLEGDLYLKDLDTGALLRVDAAEDGTPSEAGRPANQPSIDAAGRFVAFSSSDVALVDVSIAPPFTTNVYVKDTATGEVIQVPHPTSPGNAIGDTSLSADGTLVAFQFSNISSTTHFVQDLTDDSFDSFAGEEPFNGDTPVLSSDGSALAYHDPADRSQLVLRDLDGGTVVPVSETADGTAGDGFSLNPSMSDDGQLVAFESSSGNFTTPAQTVEQIYLKDVASETITLISSNALDEPADQRALNPSMSNDGRYVAFQSFARNLIPGIDPDNFTDVIYVKDLQTGWIAAVSVIPIENFDLRADARAEPTSDQQGTIDFLFAAGQTPRISGDGRYIVFVSAETNLVLGDNDGKNDVYRVENPLWEPPAP